MPATAVIGAQWGDEGKGKITDMLAAESDVVARYGGGDNAGHTVVVGGDTFKLHLVPSGILYSHVVCVLGGGMVVNPRRLLQEMDGLAARGVDVSAARLLLSIQAHLILPYHKLLEAAEEERLGDKAIGTTRRGIGPAYEDKMARRGLRMGDLRDANALAEKLSLVVEYKNLILQRVYHAPPVDSIKLYEELNIPFYHAYALFEFGLMYKMKGDAKKAAECFEASAKTWDELGNHYESERARKELAEVEGKRKKRR